MNTKTKEYLTKNWKSIVFILVVTGLILFNVKQYKSSTAIYNENLKINTEYQESLKREAIYNQQIAEYKSLIDAKNAEIKESKQEIAETESELQVSQKEVKRLSKKVLNGDPSNLKDYVEVCDSLAIIAPILSDQVDTLKLQNKVLVKTIEDKSAIQDSIIIRKDIIIADKTAIMNKTLNEYNRSIGKLESVEKKLAKEKNRKSIWKKIAIGLGLVVGGVIATK